MSELMNISNIRGDYRRGLLTSVCALALLGFFCGAIEPAAADDDHPTVWIELGGQLERMDGGQTPYAPPFFDVITTAGLKSPLAAGKPSIYSNGAEAVISFTPGDSDWVFSGSVRYGRSDGHRLLHQQFAAPTTPSLFGTGHKYGPANYAGTKADNSEAHIIADFQAGKDVGLGMFGGGSLSVFSAGIRFAQFSAKSDIAVHAIPDDRFVLHSAYGYKIPFAQYHRYYATAQRAASFRGLGPSLSWKASSPLVGNPHDGEIALDWGANAAVLFGRQKAVTHHHSTGSYHYRNAGLVQVTAQLTPHTGGGVRSHEVVVPNVGAFVGLSFCFAQAKISVGYRGDFFFGAMDGGLDTHKSYNQEFYGPFTTISIGLGG